MRLALLLCVVAGCGGAAAPSPPTANDPGYPSGPYGSEPGFLRRPPDVIPDLVSTGKIIPVGGDAASTPAETISAGIDAFPTYFIVDTSNMTIADRTTAPLVAQPLDPRLDNLLAGP